MHQCDDGVDSLLHTEADISAAEHQSTILRMYGPVSSFIFFDLSQGSIYQQNDVSYKIRYWFVSDLHRDCMSWYKNHDWGTKIMIYMPNTNFPNTVGLNIVFCENYSCNQNIQAVYYRREDEQSF